VLEATDQAATSPEATSPEAASPAVRIGGGQRPETSTHVQFAEWEGPLGLLLSLIEARRLEILTVPLGALAEAYLDALGSLNEDRIGNISTFVAVASQLILIKSRAMLPRQVTLEPGAMPDEGDDPEQELRARLLIYRAYRDAGTALQSIADARVGLFRREPSAALAAGLAGARPADGPPLDAEILAKGLAGLARIIPDPEPPPEMVARTITLTQRASLIREALRGAPTIVLQDLLLGVRDRVVVAVTFLAMLELMKRREIVVEQADSFGPITARRTTREERAAAGIAEDIEEAPLDESLESFA
jgi:segregation and condensation protein A